MCMLHLCYSTKVKRKIYCQWFGCFYACQHTKNKMTSIVRFLFVMLSLKPDSITSAGSDVLMGSLSAQRVINPAGGRAVLLIHNNGKWSKLDWTVIQHRNALLFITSAKGGSNSEKDKVNSWKPRRFNWRASGGFGTMRYHKTLSTEKNCSGKKKLMLWWCLKSFTAECGK